VWLWYVDFNLIYTVLFNIGHKTLVFFDGLGKYEKVDHVFYDAQVNDIIITNIKFIVRFKSIKINDI
jgi:hypothetical protein